ncbi:MAG: hypothetical protein RBR86_05225 [Pseudobdellovibrionaceae bacterium]|jgi:hypothetical protein|nr:hypothetical protein [Pseudobdellovibrionaceae bacterium]
MMMSSLNNAADIQQKESCGTSRGEAGNVLFLILIAVALFAALSYAVTQSTRSGGGDASSETNLVNSSQISQYPAGVKTAITRMIISNNVSADELLFDPPSTFSSLVAGTENEAVFHPTGGGAIYSEAPASVMNSVGPGTWHFNAENEVLNIGTDGSPSTDSADIIAFLPDVKKAICDSIHSKLGLSLTYVAITTVDYASDMATGNTGIPVAPAGDVIGGALAGQPQGCFLDGTTYVYFHVLVER